MLKKFSLPFFAALAALGLILTFAPAASASNVGQSGCTKLFLEYDNSGGNQRFLKWVEASNVCAGGYNGHHDFYNPATGQTWATGPSGWGPPNFRVNINSWVPVGARYCARGWQNNNNGTWTKRGDVCVNAS